MKLKDNENLVNNPKNQLKLFGYKKYIDSFIKLYNDKKIPQTILLSGPKGSGKSTFAYHFINYIFSINEDKKYDQSNCIINEDNASYKLMYNNIHPNFFLIETSKSDDAIKIEKIRNLLKFLNKSTYSMNLKVVMIDNAENLNLNASNALLKVLEEPPLNTIFFVVHDSNSKILRTIKSRSNEFKFFFNLSEKVQILKDLFDFYKIDLKDNDTIKDYYFETPGNLVKYFSYFNKHKININEDIIKCISILIDQYNDYKDIAILSYISLLIEIFYNKIYLNNNNLGTYFINQSKIISQINNMKKFNLNEKSTFLWIKNILANDSK